MKLENNLNFERIGKKFEFIGKIFYRMNYWKYCLILTIIFTLKNGIRGILPWGDFSPVEDFPKPMQTFSSNSYGLIIISKYIRATNKNSFFLLNLVLLIIMLILLYWFIFKRFNKENSRYLILIFLSSPVFIVLSGNIGRHDLFTVFGMLFSFIFKNRKIQLSCIFLACMGSPEHVLAAFILYFLVCKVFSYKSEVNFSKIVIFFSATFTILSSIWVHLEASGASRFGNILTQPQFILMGIRNFSNNFLLEWYSYFGFYWVFIFMVIFGLSRSKGLKISYILIFTMIFNIVMVDKTRDFVVAILPSAILILRELYKSLTKKLSVLNPATRSLVFGIFLSFTFLFPSVEITFEGQPRAPYFWLIDKIIEVIN